MFGERKKKKKKKIQQGEKNKEKVNDSPFLCVDGVVCAFYESGWRTSEE